MHFLECYKRGVLAGETKQPRDKNPYKLTPDDVGQGSHKAWDNGWVLGHGNAKPGNDEDWEKWGVGDGWCVMEPVTAKDILVPLMYTARKTAGMARRAFANVHAIEWTICYKRGYRVRKCQLVKRT